MKNNCKIPQRSPADISVALQSNSCKKSYVAVTLLTHILEARDDLAVKDAVVNQCFVGLDYSRDAELYVRNFILCCLHQRRHDFVANLVFLNCRHHCSQ